MTKQMTISEYIETITTMNDVMSLAKQLKKQDIEMKMVDAIVANGRVKLMQVNPEEYDRYIKYVGCHKGISEDYGCMKYEINANHGGSIKISDWIDVENSGGSLATIHISNGWGMGGSEYINNLKDVDKQIEKAKRITWINDQEREFLINALENLKRGTK